jgi:glycosyltransferase involved in cell wall biosynthesis
VKILLLAPHPFFQARGTPLAERALIVELTAAGHQVDVLTFPEGDDPAIPGCRVRRLPALPGMRGLRPGFSVKKLVLDAVMLGALLRLVRRRRYDLVHAVEESAFLALAAGWLSGVPYVYDMDSSLADQMIERFPPLARARRLLEACERRAVRGSAGVLAVCRSLEDKARVYAPAALVARLEDASLVPVAPEGGAADLPAAAAAPSERLADLAGGESAGPIALYVGNLEPYQGIDLLLASFRLVVDRLPAARLVVIGGERESIERYRARCRELGMAGAVAFAGPRPVERLGTYLRQADVLVSPRLLGTNTPMKVYSYLASGRPVVATRLPTHTQVLTDEVACLVDPEPVAFALGLIRLFSDPAEGERLGAAARRLAEREHSPEAYRARLLAFYAALGARLAPSSAPPPAPTSDHARLPRLAGRRRRA